MYKFISKVIGSTAIAAMLVLGGVASSGAVSIDPLSTIADADLGNAVADGGPFDIFAGPHFWGATFIATDVSGAAVFEIVNTSGTQQTVGVSIATIQQGAGIFGGGVTVSWDGGASEFIAEGVSTSVSVATVLAAGASDLLRIVWGDPSGVRANIDVTVAAVPLPPALLMLFSALVGLGFLSRRRARVAA